MPSRSLRLIFEGPACASSSAAATACASASSASACSSRAATASASASSASASSASRQTSHPSAGPEPEHLQVSAGEAVEFLSEEYVYAEDCTNPERCGWIPTEVLIGELCDKTPCYEVKAYYDNAAAGHGDSEHLVVLPGEEVRVNFPTFIKVAVCADPQRRADSFRWHSCLMILMTSLLRPPKLQHQECCQ